MKKTTPSYEPSGIYCNPSPRKNTVTVHYDGLLAKSGAQEIYMCIGQGKTWKNTCYKKMNSTPSGWETELPMSVSVEKINFCFKDGANNWDNNSGNNYQMPK